MMVLWKMVLSSIFKINNHYMQSTLINMFVNHWQLIKNLTSREIKARYKQSFLGFFWIILNPFFQMLIMSFVFTKILRFVDTGVAYPIFLYAGLLPWGFMAASLTSSMDVLPSNSSLIKKIYFPRQILVIATVLAKVFDFVLASSIFILLMWWFKVPFTWHSLLFFPIFLIQFIFSYALSLLLSALNLFYRDVQYLFSLILTVWFYLTPILYSVEFFPEQYRWIFKLNPMSVFINAYRQVLLAHDTPNWTSLAVGAGMSIVLYLFSSKIFKKLEGTFADVV